MISEKETAMYVQCLGSGDAFGSGGKFNTSFYLKIKSSGVLMDCGASTLIALKKAKLSADDIEFKIVDDGEVLMNEGSNEMAFTATAYLRE